MRRIGIGLALAALVLVTGCAVQYLRLSVSGALTAKPEGALRVASHNVHYILLGQQSGRWSETGWHARKEALDAVFKTLDADLVAFQEMESFQRGSDGSVNLARDFLQDRNPDFGVAATGDWRDFPSTQPIFYRKSALRPVDQGWFFFSDTPDEIYSRTFDGSYPAFCSWVQFETPRGWRFTVFNVHFEYRSRSNRRLSAALVAERVAPVIQDDMPVLLVGDLNALSGSRTQRILGDAGLTFLDIPGSTFHLDRGLHVFGAIDHIAHSDDMTPIGPAQVVQRAFDGVYPSDHYPIVADFTLPNS